MSGPSNLRLKRRITDEAPDFLILQGQGDKLSGGEVRYARQRKEEKLEGSGEEARFLEPIPEPAPTQQQAKKKRKAADRVYHLQPKAEGNVAGSKRSRAEDGDVATFAEKKQKSKDVENEEIKVEEPQEETIPFAPQKRPGRGAAVRRTDSPAAPESDAERRQFEQLADYMHQAALEEIKRESKAKVPVTPKSPPAAAVAQPKLSGSRSREIHRQRTSATNGSANASKDVEMSEDEDYVYDTYVLAPTIEASGAETTQSMLDNVGYLVITAEDQSLWETYLEDETSDRDGNSDDEDENAEDYYGADYPEDELDSDDEFGRNAYGYREHGASDDEEWEAHSEDEEFERMMDPFKQSTSRRQFAKYLHDGADGD